MEPGFERWCGGLREIGERRLTELEVRHLASAIARVRSQHRGYRWFSRGAAAVLALGVVLFAAAMPPRATANAVLTFVMASLGVLLLLAGIGGALGEVVFGFNPLSRGLFGLALATFGTVVGFGLESDVAQTAATVCAIFVFVIGAAMFVLRFAAVRHSVQLADAAARDLSAGRVAQFAGRTEVSSQAEQDVDDTDATVAAPDALDALPAFEHHTLEVLPASGVIVRIDGELAKTLQSAPIDEAATVGDSLEAPAAPQHELQVEPGVAVTQRSLRTAEKDELRRLITRTLENAAVSSLGVLWFSGIVARGLDRALTGWSAEGLSTRALWGALAMTALFIAARLNHVRLLRLDLRQGIVLVGRARGRDLDFSLEEVLGRSRVLWTQFGQPAAWRLGRGTRGDSPAEREDSSDR